MELFQKKLISVKCKSFGCRNGWRRKLSGLHLYPKKHMQQRIQAKCEIAKKTLSLGIQVIEVMVMMAPI